MISIENINESLKNKSGVYSISNKINGKHYFGSTSGKNGFYSRFSQHLSKLRNNKHPNYHLQAAWNKYGEEAFEFKIRTICSKEFCLKIEQIYLDTVLLAKGDINTFWKLGYNLSPTAGNNSRFKYNQRQRENIGESLRGKPSPRKGISNERIKGGNHFMYGKKWKEETLIKMSTPILQYDLDGNFVREWYGISKASQSLGISAADISAVISDRQKSAKGFIWRKWKENYPLKINKINRDESKKYPKKSIKSINLITKQEEIFESAWQASKKLSIDHSSIIKCCKGKLTKIKNYNFTYE